MILVDYAPVLPELFSLGLVGVGLVSWLGDDGSDEVDQEGDGEGEFDMGEDDEFGMDDFDEDFGEMDGIDEGGGGATSTELENRIEDLESEIANVSSTANTVRSENEQISEKVEDVEENVRKLLEIYEMVTRGVNPFVDDVSPDAGLGGGGGSDFGLFGDDEDTTEEPEADLGSDIADAEAEDFFEDDAFEADFEDGDDEFESEADAFDDGFEDPEESAENELEAEFDDFEEDESMADDSVFDEEGAAESSSDSSGDGDGGTSFEELKAEYESGEADWADEEDDQTGTEPSADTEPTTTAQADESVDLFQQDDLEGADDGTGAEPVAAAPESEPATPDPGAADEEPADSTIGSESGADPAEDHSEDVAASAATESDTASLAGPEDDAGFQFGAATATDPEDQPHLTRPPDGYLSDVLLMEWLEYLVAEFDARNAIRALNHYERIGWIGEPMRDHCYEMLQGITDGTYPYRDESGPTELGMDDHRRSLRYIEDLATGHLDRELGDRITAFRTDGIQR